MQIDGSPCKHCGNCIFQYDSYWNEYSCEECGYNVNDLNHIDLLEKNKNDKTKKIEKDTASSSSACQTVETSDQQTNRLWQEAVSLGWSDEEQKKAVEIYTQILSLVGEQSDTFNVCGVFRNRAIAHRSLKEYDSALEDLTTELRIAQNRNDQMRILDCNKITQQTLERKIKAQIEFEGGKKASKFESMEEKTKGLRKGDQEFQSSFDSLFSDLENDDPDIRAEASKCLGSHPNSIQKITATYLECLDSDPIRASLAGRVLGRLMTKGSDTVVNSDTAQMLYGIPAAFVPCSCVHCGKLNAGVATPPNGPFEACYHQKNKEGAHAVPVLCDACGKVFFVARDTDPR